MNAVWERRSLSEVCTVIQDGAHQSPKRQYSHKAEGRFLYITSKNIRNNFIDLTNVTYVDREFHTQIYPRCRPEAGDVLLTKDGVGTGNVCLNTLHEPFSLLSSVCLIKTNPAMLLSPFLSYYIQSPDGLAQITGEMTGAAIKRIILQDIKAATIPLPSLAEQRRLVGVLDEVLSAIATAKSNTEKNLQNVRALLDTETNAILSDGNGDRSVQRLGGLVALSRGHNPPKSKFSATPKPGYVRFYQIRDGKSDDHAVYVPDSPQLHKMKADDIMMVAYRHIGGVFRGVTGAFNVALCKITNVRKDVLNDDYLFQILPSRYVRGELLKRSERSLIPSMSIEHLRQIEIPLPGLAAQQEMVGKIMTLGDRARRLESTYVQKLSALEELKKSLLHRAFTGGLQARR